MIIRNEKIGKIAVNPANSNSSINTERTGELNTKDIFISSNEQKPAATATIKIKTFPSDPFMDKEPIIMEIERDKIGQNLSNDRIIIYDKNNIMATPDNDGNYLYEPGQPQFNQVNSFYIIEKTLEIYDKLFGYKVQKVVWNHTLPIFVQPNHEEESSTYGDNEFGYGNMYIGKYKSNNPNKTVFMAQSADIVSHETGHAVLRYIKPHLGADPESKAFCEAFADITSIIYFLSIDYNCEKLITETGGNLLSCNRLSLFSEEWFTLKYNKFLFGIRSFINNYKYQPTTELPKQDTKTETDQRHDFSRILSGAFYNLLVSLYQNELAQSKIENNSEITKKLQINALNNAGKKIGSLFAKAVQLAPNDSISFKNFALCLISADKQIYNSRYKELLKKEFLERNILSESDIDN